MKWLEAFIILLIPIVMFCAGGYYGFVMGSNIENARKIVIQDNLAHQKFDAEYQRAMHPDFLETISPKR